MNDKSLSFKPRFIIRTLIIVIVLAVIGICVYQAYMAKQDFNSDVGSGDYWRIPLQYPYEISIIDTFDYAALA